MLPNAFIAGAQKSGTSTLCHLLGSHPDVVLSDPKEPAFFSRPPGASALRDYEKCFKARNRIAPHAVIDGSTAYMVDPSAPERIRSTLGDDIRFIFCLRDPVERMISAYWHQAKKGQDLRLLDEVFDFRSLSLAEAVAEEEDRIHAAVHDGLVAASAYAARFADPLWNFRYLRNSLYAADLDRFFENFSRQRVKLILFDELIGDPARLRTALAAFLDLDPHGFPNEVAPRNPTLLARAPGLLETLRRLPGRTILRRLPGYERLVRSALYRRPPVAAPGLKQQLRRLVAPEVKRLEAILDRPLPAWHQAEHAGVTGDLRARE